MSTLDNSTDSTAPVKVSAKNASDTFLKELEKVHTWLSMENNQINLKENWFWGGGKNVEANDYTLIIQNVPSITNPDAGSYLSLAIYDLTFDENGQAYTTSGNPLTNYDFEKHCLLHQEIEPMAEEEMTVWCDRERKEQKYSTQELISKWVQELLKRSARTEEQSSIHWDE